jgi:hypothetical protein
MDDLTGEPTSEATTPLAGRDVQGDFQSFVAADLEAEGIKGDDAANLERFYLAEVEAMTKANPASASNPNYFTRAYDRGKENWRKWQGSIAKWTALHGSDEEFMAYSSKVEKERHEQQREKIRDRALAAQQRVVDQHEAVKKTDGRSTWELTDEEFKARDARKKDLDRAAMIEKQRLADDTFRMQVREERRRREGKK